MHPHDLIDTARRLIMGDETTKDETQDETQDGATDETTEQDETVETPAAPVEDAGADHAANTIGQ